jgi:hypothetical protein
MLGNLVAEMATQRHAEPVDMRWIATIVGIT